MQSTDNKSAKSEWHRTRVVSYASKEYHQLQLARKIAKDDKFQQKALKSALLPRVFICEMYKGLFMHRKFHIQQQCS
jgi:hypothetical protein